MTEKAFTYEYERLPHSFGYMISEDSGGWFFLAPRDHCGMNPHAFFHEDSGRKHFATKEEAWRAACHDSFDFQIKHGQAANRKRYNREQRVKNG